MLAKIGEAVKEDFTVVNDSQALVTGLEDDDFSKNLYDPDGNDVSGTVNVTVSELGNGNYRAIFTPNSVGTWYLMVRHDMHFPWGKEDTIQVFNQDFDSISDLLVRILGLTQENQYIDNTSYDDDDNLISCRVRLYDDSTKVGTDQSVIETYHVTAGYTNSKLDYYKVVRQ